MYKDIVLLPNDYTFPFDMGRLYYIHYPRRECKNKNEVWITYNSMKNHLDLNMKTKEVLRTS